MSQAKTRPLATPVVDDVAPNLKLLSRLVFREKFSLPTAGQQRRYGQHVGRKRWGQPVKDLLLRDPLPTSQIYISSVIISSYAKNMSGVDKSSESELMYSISRAISEDLRTGEAL